MPIALEPPKPKPNVVAVDKRREALDRRDSLMAEFLVRNPEAASIYEQAVLSGDAGARNQLDEMIVERITELDPNVNQFEVTPEEKRVVPQRPGYPSMGQMIPLEQRMRGAIEVIPAVNTPLYSPSMERLYDYVDNGLLGNLRAKPGSPDYIENDFVTVYAGMVRERTQDYPRHKHYHAIRQRIGEQLAATGAVQSAFGFAAEKAEEVIRGTVPFIEDFPDKPEWFPGADKAKQKRVTALMELADESTAGYQMGGKIIGLLGGGMGVYTKLLKMGMTRFIGVGNVQKAKSFLATATAEVGIDMAYNPNGYTMVLGALMDDDQNRILSAAEAVALGTAFNLGIDKIRALKGKKLKDSIKELQKEIGTRGDFINVLRKRVAQGEPEVPAKEMVKQPPVEIHLPKGERLTPMRPEQEQAIEATLVGSNAKSWARIHELEEWNKATPHSVHRARRNLKEIEAIKKDLGVLDVEDQLRANQMADDAISQPAAATPEEVARRLDLPERNVIDMNDWIKASAEEKGPIWSRLAFREGLMHGLAAPMGIGLLGGALSMSSTDEDKVGAFAAGMMLPLAPGNALRRFATKYRQWTPGPRAAAARYVGVPFRSTVTRISKTMGWEVLRNRVRSMMEAHQKLETASVYFKHMDDLIDQGVISQAEKELIHNGLDNGRRVQAMDAFDLIDGRRKASLVASGAPKKLQNRLMGETKMYFEAMEQIIRDIGKESDRIGLEMGFIENYFARSISPKNYKKFLKEKAIVKDSRITAAWKAMEKDMGKSLLDHEKAQIANNVLQGYGHGSGGKPGFMKTRKFTEVPDELRKYYDSFEESQIRYITQMTDAINLHKWLGVGLTKNRLTEMVEKVEISPGVVDKFTKKVRSPEFKGKYDYKKTIGEKIRKAVERDGLTEPQIDDLTNLLHSRYATPMGRPSPEWMGKLRDVGYMMTIGNPYSTITQFSDVLLAAALSDRGMGGTVFETVLKKLSGDKMTYTLADGGIDPKGLDRILADLTDQAATSKWLRRNLELTGFSHVDVFGKETLINATYESLRKAARSATKTPAYRRLVNEYKHAMGDDFDDFVAALRKGDSNNGDVKAAVFGRLFDQHPASIDDMPLGYIKHPQARIMYSLKSFTIKQIDLLRKRTLDQIVEGLATGNNLMVKDGMRDSMKYAILFGGSIQGFNWLKDFMLGREVELSDRGVDYFMQLAGLHRFHIEKVRRIVTAGKPSEEVWKMLGGLTPPAAGILADSIMPDMAEMDVGGAAATGAAFGGAVGGLPGAAVGGGIGALTSLAGEQEMELSQGRGNKLSVLGVETPIRDKYIPYLRARSWRYIPFLGRDVFWTIGRGLEWVAKRLKKPARGKRRAGRPKPTGRPTPTRR